MPTPYVRPETYGAVGNGTTDDRIALQRSVDELGKLGGGDLILSRKYALLLQPNTTQPHLIVNFSGINIIGETGCALINKDARGRTLTIGRNVEDEVALLPWRTYNALLGFSVSYISGTTYSHTGPNFVVGDEVVIYTTTGTAQTSYVFYNARVISISNGRVILDKFCSLLPEFTWKIAKRHTTVQNISISGVEFISSGGNQHVLCAWADHIQISDCIFRGADFPADQSEILTGPMGPYFTYTRFVNVQNCEVIGGQSGIVGGAGAEGIRVRDCKISKTWDYGIFSDEPCIGWDVSGVEIFDCARGAIRLMRAEGNFENLYIHDNCKTPNREDVGGVALKSCRNLRLANARIENNHGGLTRLSNIVVFKDPADPDVLYKNNVNITLEKIETSGSIGLPNLHFGRGCRLSYPMPNPEPTKQTGINLINCSFPDRLET